MSLPRLIGSAAAELGFAPADLIPYGNHFAKLPLPNANTPPRGKLILVTAITPTAHGEGKTVTTIGLAQALRQLGHRAVATVRQPSMGPVFGAKGGATGGGLAKVVPPEPINLHFTGDFHAITSAHNLLSALIDAHLFYGNELDLDPEQILWPRTLDVNDRALRRLTLCLGKGNGEPHSGQFVITAASEVMAIFALATGYEDLRRRLGNITIAWNRSGEPVYARDLGAVGAMMALLRDALQPNLAQTADGTPVFIHAGPFANIAHGTASVLSQRLALQHADFVVNEAGFGSDLGAEKFFDIVMPASGLCPAAAVVVATLRAVQSQGQAQGEANLARHLDIVRKFGVPAVVAINQFPQDDAGDLAALRRFCEARQVPCAFSRVFSEGAPGGLELARAILDLPAANPQPLYTSTLSTLQKIEKIATEIYGAANVDFAPAVHEKAQRYDALGLGHFPICMVKTPLSFTADPKISGAPSGWTLPVTDLIPNTGAEFLVAITGATVRMPGLGKSPHALRIDLSPDGDFIGVC
jgi:formate--tetrahydrofolate ligase